MKIRRMIIVLFLLSFAVTFASCGREQSSEAGASNAEANMGGISSRREGIYRQGLPFPGIFSASDTGVYSLNPVELPGKDYAQLVLFYTEYGSDTAVRLCSRPDCTHSDESCDASLTDAGVILFYKGHLYYSEVSMRSKSDYRFSLKIIRVDPDGRNRTCIMDTQNDIQFDDGYFGFPMFTDGMFFFTFYWLDETGTEQSQRYCYRLDGSMKMPQAVDAPLLYGTDGDATFFYRPDDMPEYYIWNPDEMTVTSLFSLDKETGCYLAEECAYLMKENKIYRKDYKTGEETLLFDTGLTGTHRVSWFPDCIVIRDGVAYDGSEPELEQQTLYFYNWKFEPLGEVTLGAAFRKAYAGPIAAETPDKLLLRVDYSYLPRYYIDKSEFGTGNITLHEFKLPRDIPAVGEQPE